MKCKKKKKKKIDEEAGLSPIAETDWGPVYTWSLHAFYLIMKRPDVYALRNTFEMDLNPITQTTSGGCSRHIPDRTGQV